MDGGMCKRRGSIYANGVISDTNIGWLGGFSLNRGVGNVLDAEFWGLLEGLSLTWKAGFRKILVESDSLILVELLGKDDIENHPLFTIISSCKLLLNKDWDCRVKHMFRECNRLANDLASIGKRMSLGMMVFKAPPANVLKTF
ncbi:hypothetical protein ACOSP7_000511 [Xanthoceras sorbifolium]